MHCNRQPTISAFFFPTEHRPAVFAPYSEPGTPSTLPFSLSALVTSDKDIPQVTTARVRLSSVPCRHVPCRAVPCSAVPCRAVQCRAVQCRAVLSCRVPWRVVCTVVSCSAPSRSVSRRSVPCHADPFRVTPPLSVSRRPVPCHSVTFRVTPSLSVLLRSVPCHVVLFRAVTFVVCRGRRCVRLPLGVCMGRTQCQHDLKAAPS